MLQKETERLAVVTRYLTLEISKDKELQEIVDTAAKITGSPIALITFVDHNTNYIKFRYGIDIECVILEDTFCSHAIKTNSLMVVTDSLQDERFVNNPLVTDYPNIRFYAGAPLTTHDGFNLGTLCVIDHRPKELSAEQDLMLRLLAKQVINLLEFDSSLRMLKQKVTDITSAEIKLRSFFESSASCHLLIGKNLEVLAFNKTLSDFAKAIYNLDIYEGMSASNVFPEPLLTDFLEGFYQAIEGIPVQRERVAKHNDMDIWWYITYRPVRTTEGEIIGVSFNATDITERLGQEQKVSAQNESLKKIAFLHAHELRKPVASILGLVNLFRMDNYNATKEELLMLEQVTNELDEKIKTIIGFSD